MTQNTVSIKLNTTQMESFSDMMQALGWIEKDINNEYIKDAYISPNGSVATLYSSGKLVLQGGESFTKTIAYIKGSSEQDVEVIPHIGVDEVGKGDYFGPLVVVACFVDEDFVEKISYLGFDDSKKFSDEKIIDLYSRVKDYPYYYPIVLYPTLYDDAIKEFNNLSLVLAKQHTKCIENGLEDLKSKDIECKRVVIDQFSSSKNRILDELGTMGKQVEIVQFHKGESDIAVAAASIIARGIFLEEMEKMSREYGFKFPKGASNVIEPGKEFVQRFGQEKLREVAKISFKTTKKVLSLF